MKSLTVLLPAVAITLVAGCASQSSSTTAMGAGPASPQARTVYCRDGARVTPKVGCGMDGGVERDMTPPAQK